MDTAIVKDKNKMRAVIATILFHAILAVLFILFGLSYQFPPPEQGILINFGSSSDGRGKVQPDLTGDNAKTKPNPSVMPHEEKTQESAIGKKTSMTSEHSAISVPEETEEEKQKRFQEELQRQQEAAFTKKLENVWEKADKQGGQEGETARWGDQGDPEGSKLSASHTGGTRHGKGRYRLNGRSLLYAPTVSEQSQKEGIVVVSIIVDKKGNVIQATAGIKGTTTTDHHLWKVAREAALKYKFNSNLYAPEEQMGEITFTFVLR